MFPRRENGCGIGCIIALAAISLLSPGEASMGQGNPVKTSSAPPKLLPLNVWHSNTFQYSSDGEFTSYYTAIPGVAVTMAATAFPEATLAKNQVNIYNEPYAGINNSEVGTAEAGRKHIKVNEDKISLFFPDQDDSVYKHICAFTMAHEIGHVILGWGHQVGSTVNVMTDRVTFVLPGFQATPSVLPSFDKDQGATIQGYLKP